MKCIIDFYVSESGNIPVRDFIYSLREEQISKILRDLDLLEEYGSYLTLPHASQIKGKRYKGLHELRTKTIDGIFRIFYFFVLGNKCILVHGFQKKTQKTPKKELELALERMNDWKKRENKNS